MFPGQSNRLQPLFGGPLATTRRPLCACAAVNPPEMREMFNNIQFAATEKLKHQNRTIFKQAMVHDVRSLHDAKMKVNFACRPCSMPFCAEGN